MTDYPRRERQSSPPAPQPVSRAQSAYDEPDEQRKPTVRVPIVQPTRDALSAVQRVEYIECEIDAAQDWDERVWNGGAYGSGDPYQRW